MKHPKSQPNSQMQEVLDLFASFQAPALEKLSPENARNLPTFSDAVNGVIGKHVLKRAMPFPEPVGEIKHLLIPGTAGELLARVYSPKTESDEALPVLLYFHGGGWVIANLDTYDGSCRALCNESGYIVISVAYRQAPEHPFPAAVEDAFAAYEWVTANAQSFGGDASKIAVAGESAGGNLAAVVCLKAKRKGIPLPIHQLLVYPVTDLTFAGKSHQTQADAQPLNAAMMDWFKKHYLRPATDATNPDVSPLFAANHTGLPSATVILAKLDPLFSDGEAYAEKLESAGVRTQLKVFGGVGHEFFGAKAVIDEAKSAIAFAGEELKKALTPEFFTASSLRRESPREAQVRRATQMF